MKRPAGLTESLSDFLHAVDYDDLPEEDIEKAKLFLLDFIGYAASSAEHEPAHILRRVARALGGNEESTVIGSPWRTSCTSAAMINAALGHITELDDTHRSTQTHPANAVMPAVLAIGEREKADGRRVLAAIVAGYDCVIRAGSAVMPSHYTKGWHPSGTVHTFGAAVAAVKLLGLSAAQMQHALGLAGAQAAGNFAHVDNRALAKDLNPAKAATNGVLAALLAAEGFTGSTDIFENSKGFLTLYSDSAAPQKLVENLGAPFLIRRVAHKPFPGCRHLHAARDATLELMERHGIRAEDVDEITIRMFTVGARVVDDPKPWVGNKGSFGPHYSAQFQVAITLAEGMDGLWASFDESYWERKLCESRIRRLTKRVRLVPDDDLNRTWPNAWSTIVEARTRSGATLSARVDLPKGEPENPMSAEEVIAKFDRLACRVYSDERRTTIRNLVFRLEECPDISEVTKHLTGNID